VHGRPAQQISGEFNINREVRDLSTEELMALLAPHRVIGARGAARANPLDTIIRRWQALTGSSASHGVSGRSFDDLARETETANAA